MSEIQKNEPDNKKETVKEVKQKFDLVGADEDYKAFRAKRIETARAKRLVEARSDLQDLVPGIDMDAFDRCVGTDYIEQLDVMSTLKGGLLCLQRDYGKGLSAQGIENLNHYLNQNRLDEVESRCSFFQSLYYSMDSTKMPLDLRERVVPLALDLNHIKIMALVAPKGDYSVIVTSPSGQRTLNEVYTPAAQ